MKNVLITLLGLGVFFVISLIMTSLYLLTVKLGIKDIVYGTIMLLGLLLMSYMVGTAVRDFWNDRKNS